jgi:hypothetical protein
MKQKIIVVVGLNEEGEGIELRHEVAHKVSLVRNGLYWWRRPRGLAFDLDFHHCWAHEAQLAIRIRTLRTPTHHPSLSRSMSRQASERRQWRCLANLFDELVSKLNGALGLNVW